MDLPKEERENLIKYLDGAIGLLETRIEPLRQQLQGLIREKSKLIKIRKCIK